MAFTAGSSARIRATASTPPMPPRTVRSRITTSKGRPSARAMRWRSTAWAPSATASTERPRRSSSATVTLRTIGSSSITKTRPVRDGWNDCVAAGASSSTVLAGRKIVKTLPRPTSERTLMAPPWFLTTEYAVARPSPLPRCLVVKYGSKMRGKSASGMPMPVSLTSSAT